MNGFIIKARRNLDFLKVLESEFPDEYFEWKATIIFYIALNLTKGYLEFMGITPANNHLDIQKQIDSNSSNSEGAIFDALYPKEYYRIREFSEQSRYDPIANDGLFDAIWKDSYSKAKIKLNRLIDFVTTKGIIL